MTAFGCNKHSFNIEDDRRDSTWVRDFSDIYKDVKSDTTLLELNGRYEAAH